MTDHSKIHDSETGHSKPDAMTNLLRGLSLCAVLLASSCAAPGGSFNGLYEDGAVNHPISVEPAYQSLKLSYNYTGLAPADMAQLDAFVTAYRAHGNGSIAVNVPAGTSANAAISYFAEHIVTLGVGRDHIIVAQHDAPRGDMRVEINYLAYQASVAKCGDWSEDLDKTLDNSTSRNFGCSVQQNIAAMVADPRDLMGPRPMDDADTTRRTAVVDHYEKGEVTQATKRTADLSVEQSAPGSDVK